MWASTDGGATFSLVLPGSINEVKFDPGNSSTVYATLASSATGGLLRSTPGGALGSWTPILQENRARLSFAPVMLPNGKTRIYVADASAGGTGRAGVPHRRREPARGDADRSGPCVPATTATTCANAAWTRLSNSTDGTPGFAVYNYCNTPLVGSQCGYDMFIMSPPEPARHGRRRRAHALRGAAAVRPPDGDRVVGMRSNGRAVLMSMDAGATWTDVTGDVGGESMHPDQHALAFVPGDPDKFFVGSDGGMIRTSGEWADASSQCDTRPLPPPDLIPALPSRTATRG